MLQIFSHRWFEMTESEIRHANSVVCRSRKKNNSSNEEFKNKVPLAKRSISSLPQDLNIHNKGKLI